MLIASGSDSDETISDWEEYDYGDSSDPDDETMAVVLEPESEPDSPPAYTTD